MITISIATEALAAIEARLPNGSDGKGGYLIMLQPAPNYNLSYTNLNTLPACWLSMDVVTLFRVRMS